jgi:hypothetical protein
MAKTTAIWTGVSTAIVGFATVLGAQTTSAPQSTSPNTEAQITVTGCLKQGLMTVGPAGTAGVAGAAGAAGTAGTAGTTGAATTADSNASALMFTLTNATSAPADASSTSATSSTTGAASTTGAPTAPSGSSGQSGQSYRLIANPTALSPLVGKKLALTGVLDPQDNADLKADPSAGPDANAPVLRVKSGKIVAASCQ